jgi:hypothetical protein
MAQKILSSRSTRNLCISVLPYRAVEEESERSQFSNPKAQICCDRHHGPRMRREALWRRPLMDSANNQAKNCDDLRGEIPFLAHVSSLDPRRTSAHLPDVRLQGSEYSRLAQTFRFLSVFPEGQYASS